MAKIISAKEQKKRGLEDFQLAHDFFAKAHANDIAQQQQQQAARMQMQKMAMAIQQQRAQQEQLLTQQAQAGDVRSLQELALRAHKGKVQVRAEEAVKLLHGITDPKQRPIALKAIHDLYKEEDLNEAHGAAQEMLQHASESPDMFPPEQIQDWASRLEMKRAKDESPDDVMSEVMQVRRKAGEAHTNRAENEDALQQAHQVVQSLPRGSYERRQAEIALHAVGSDEASLSRQGMGNKTLKAVQRAALGPRAGFEERRQEQADARVMPGLGGMTSGEMNKELAKEPHGMYGKWLGDYGGFPISNPKIPTDTQLPGTHATKGKIFGPGKNPGSKARSEEQIIEELVKSGTPLTQENLDAALGKSD
jgi:hypothetical protein